MLRSRPDDYEKVYAEGTKFESEGGCVLRKYLIEAEVIDVIEAELTRGNLAYNATDRDEVYSKYEAAPPEWFWIEQ